MFGTVTGFLGQSFPFSAAQAMVEAVYTGRSSGNQVTLAIAHRRRKAAAYVCNGRTIEAWLQGSVNGNQISLAGNKGASLTGSLSGLDAVRHGHGERRAELPVLGRAVSAPGRGLPGPDHGQRAGHPDRLGGAAGRDPGRTGRGGRDQVPCAAA